VVSDDQKKSILKRYIFCHCHLTPELIRFFYQVPEVVGFLNHQRGDDKLPGPVSEAVVKNFLTKTKEIKPTNKEVDLKKANLVRITKGEFAGQEGRIVQINEKSQKVKIVIESSG
jgi:transcription antitermination factor NusG